MGYYMGFPMFSCWGAYPRYNSSSWRATTAEIGIQNRAAAATAAAWPYGWSDVTYGIPYYGMIDSSIPYDQAIEINRMLHNPGYIPQINTSIEESSYYSDLSQIRQQGRNQAYKDLLKILYENFGTNIKSFIDEVDTALATDGLTDTQKAKLEEFKQKAQAIEQERKDFAEKAKNMEAENAVKELDKIKQKFTTLKNEAKEFNAQQTSGDNSDGVQDDGTSPEVSVNNPNEIDEDEEITPEQLQSKYKDELKPAIKDLLNNEALTEEDKNAIQEKKKELEKAIEEGKPIEEQRTLYNELVNLVSNTNNKIAREEISKKYEAEKASIENIKDNPNIQPTYKEAIEAKQQELEQAIEDGKSPEEVNKLYNELTTLVHDANEQIVKTLDEAETKEYNALADKAAKMFEDFTKWAEDGDYKTYIPEKYKDELKSKIEALQNAIKEPKLSVEIKKIYNDCKAFIDKVKKETEQLKQESSEIAGNIYEAAAGPDFHMPSIWKTDYTEKEKIIISNVKKLNKNNIMAFLKTWENRYRNSDGHSCIIDTIRSEFLEYDGNKIETELTNHILSAIEEYAKENHLSSKIYDKIRIIKGNMNGATGDWGKVYTEFNNLLELLKIRPPQEQQPQ